MSNFKDIIYSDVIIIICKFLRPKDILIMCHMFPKIFKKISNMYITIVAREIDMFFKFTFGEKFPEFRQQMISTNAIVSGSLILQLVLGERWAGHPFNRLDVDIFVIVEPIYTEKFDYEKKKYTFYNYEHKFKLGYTGLHKLLHKLKDKNGFNGYVSHSQYKDELGENVIVRVNNYVIKEKNIFQIVELNKEKYDNYKEFINKTVDFDICKNYFYYTNDGFELDIQELHNIVYKNTQFNFVNSLRLSEQRRDKYVKRGFIFRYDPLNNYDPYLSRSKN